jgi:Ni,Fe-hydrogenase III small subunit
MTAVDLDLVGSLAARLDAESLQPLGRSLAVCIVTAGDCGGCALEVAMLRSAAYGLAPHGVCVQDTPVGADVLLVTGAMTRSLVGPVRRALQQMARPRWVVAVGDCAIDGGAFAGGPAVAGGVEAAIPVDLVVPGCPPEPSTILAALRALVAANG